MRLGQPRSQQLTSSRGDIAGPAAGQATPTPTRMRPYPSLRTASSDFYERAVSGLARPSPCRWKARAWFMDRPLSSHPSLHLDRGLCTLRPATPRPEALTFLIYCKYQGAQGGVGSPSPEQQTMARPWAGPGALEDVLVPPWYRSAAGWGEAAGARQGRLVTGYSKGPPFCGSCGSRGSARCMASG